MDRFQQQLLKNQEMGKLAIEPAIKYLKGETVDEQVDSPLELVK